jgi:hypothetical protein
MALGFNDFDAGNQSLIRAFRRGGPLNLNFFCPNGTRFAHCHVRAQKSQFQGPPLPMALILDSARIKIIRRHLNNRYININSYIHTGKGGRELT